MSCNRVEQHRLKLVRRLLPSMLHVDHHNSFDEMKLRDAMDEGTGFGINPSKDQDRDRNWASSDLLTGSYGDLSFLLFNSISMFLDRVSPGLTL